MVAFHFPPLHGSSGIQRTLQFARHLPDFGWEPHVLTVHPHAYEATGDAGEVPASLPVYRAYALDIARDLSVADRYPAFLARPDRWASWQMTAVPLGWHLVRKLRPRALWSTYPIATAHQIGHALHRLTGLPWIADFRDPMAQEGYPTDPATWRSFSKIERKAVTSAVHSVFTTSGAAQTYRARYPDHAGRMRVVENGYDEALFAGLPAGPRENSGGRRVLLHSGIVYPSERDPTALFGALRRLRDAGRIAPGNLVVRFRAPVHTDMLHELANRFGVSEMIDVAPPLGYRDAIGEMTQADGLLILQAANCNEQIPAKYYEYLRAGPPILGLADPIGDTGLALAKAGVRHIAALENEAAIVSALGNFLDDLGSGRMFRPDPAVVDKASRRERTRELSVVLDEAVSSPSGQRS